MSPEIQKTQELLASCLILKEEDINNWENIWVWSIVTVKYSNMPKSMKLLVTWISQAARITFKWQNCITVCKDSPLWPAIGNKSVWDETQINLPNGMKPTIKIISVE